MTKVPEWNLPKFKTVERFQDRDWAASLKQKNLVLNLYQQRNLDPPDVTTMTKGQAAAIIDGFLENRWGTRTYKKEQ